MAKDRRPKTLLVLSQVYVPDPASVGQHMHDAAVELARRKWRVVVFTANRGYEDPSIQYPRREMIDGVMVRRLPFSSFGKRSILIRLLGGFIFVVQATVRGLMARSLGGVLVSTSPPMCSAAAIVISAVRRVPIKYWVMDLNPDQLVALGRASPRAMLVRAFDLLNRMILKRSADVVALDRFMAERINQKRDVRSKLHVVPPWPHEDHLEPISHDANPFRREHCRPDEIVIMYSGNHSSSSPVTTILDAALQLQDEPKLRFMFIGGGDGKPAVDEAISKFKPPNILSLPYQPLSNIKYSLSAADVHVVAVGDMVVGVVHPCKIYGAMAVGRPIVFVGPCPCHASDLLESDDIGWRIAHGDVDRAVEVIRGICRMDRQTLQAMGQRAGRLIERRLSKSALLGRFADIVERGC